MRDGTTHSSMSAPVSVPSCSGQARSKTLQKKLEAEGGGPYRGDVLLVDEALVPGDDRVDEGRLDPAQQGNVLEGHQPKGKVRLEELVRDHGRLGHAVEGWQK